MIPVESDLLETDPTDEDADVLRENEDGTWEIVEAA